MATYMYTGLDSKGKESSGSLEADSQAQALSKIRELGMFPTQVSEVGAAPAKGAARKGAGPVKPVVRKSATPKKRFEINIQLPGSGRVKPKQLMTFTRQLATLVDAGLPLVRGLNVLERQEKHPGLKRAVREMAESIQSGSTFAEALAQHPRIFNKLYVNMAKAGEVGGVLDQVLVRLAEFMEKAQKIKNKVVSAMVYPVVVLIVAISILTFLMIFIIPKFKEIFADLMGNKGLPFLTQLVINTSNTLVHRGPYVLAVIVVLVVLFVLFKRTKRGSYYVDWFKLNFPLFGQLVRKTAISRFSRTLGTLMTSGVPVLQALNIVRDTAGNEVLAKAVSQVHDSVKEGENMAPPIEATRMFPPMVVSMVQVGEETGELPEMLMKIADTYDDEVDNAVAGLTSVIEPILIVFLAVIVGTIVIALFLPLISIIGSMSGQQ